MATSAGTSYLNEDLLNEDDSPPISPLSTDATTPPQLESGNASSSRHGAARPAVTSSGGQQRLVLALDFGTTFTGVAFASVPVDSHRGDGVNIEVVRNWGRGMDNMDKVPSIISYTHEGHGEPQWGSNISEDATTLLNQKLELELQESTLDELDLTMYVIDGTRCLSFDYIREAGSSPDFPCKTPDEVVTDYLRQVFKRVHGAVKIEQLTQTKTPVDLVITMPVCWSYQARNAVFRAVREAGFNEKEIPQLKETILVSEPEAAAYYTARESGPTLLKADKCFVLCDAGGGTVDAVAFQVKELHPSLKLERVTAPTGRKCGSALIDTEFKYWLRKEIKPNNYARLDPSGARQRVISPHAAEPPAMRELIKNFFTAKSRFSNQDRRTIKIQLPAPLANLTIQDRVNEGELLIQWAEMKGLMDRCVNPTVELILEQVDEVANGRGTQVKTIFLVGGFGSSPYLQEELKKNFGFKKIQLFHPSKNALTAVVQGAVIHGIERPQGKDTSCLTHNTKTFGYVGDGSSFRWFVRRGDVVQEGTSTVWSTESFWIVPPPRLRSTITFRLFRFDQHADSEDELPSDYQGSWNDVQVAGFVKLARWRVYRGSDSDARHEGLAGPFKWQVTYENTNLKADLLLNEQPVGECQQIASAICENRDEPPAGPYDEIIA